MIRIGVIGAGHLGKIHIKLLKQIPDFELVGFFDREEKVRGQVAADFEVQAFESLESLLAEVEAVDIVVPTLAHHQVATAAFRLGKHVFIEKPLTHTVAEGEALLELQAQHPHLMGQVGHVERFNPAFLAISDRMLEPMFVEGHRLAQYNPRGTDVSVVADLMIHDLDVILSVIPAPVRQIQASGVAVVSDTPDIANARIEFENGAVANLTASRISMKNMRRLRFFQRDAYLAVDFLAKKVDDVRLFPEMPEEQPLPLLPIDTPLGQKYMQMQQLEPEPVNAIQMELEEFAASIREGAPVRVSLADGLRALKVAVQIQEQIDASLQGIPV